MRCAIIIALLPLPLPLLLLLLLPVELHRRVLAQPQHLVGAHVSCAGVSAVVTHAAAAVAAMLQYWSGKRRFGCNSCAITAQGVTSVADGAAGGRGG